MYLVKSWGEEVGGADIFGFDEVAYLTGQVFGVLQVGWGDKINGENLFLTFFEDF